MRNSYVQMLIFLAAVAFITDFCIVLMGCQTTYAARPLCLPMATYSPAQQTALAAQLTALKGTPVAAAMDDYEHLRDADRRCGAKP